MKRLIKEFIEKRRASFRNEREAELMSEFKVVERGGSLWLTHNGTAFLHFSSLINAKNVTDTLHDVRETAVKFDRL